MDDDDTRALLGLLYDYVKEYGNDSPRTIAELAADLAMSLTPTTEMDDQMRRYIEMSLV